MTGHTCPFCGGHVIAHRGMYARTPPDPRGLCEDCGAYGPKRRTDEAAIRAMCEIGREARVGHAAILAVDSGWSAREVYREIVDAMEAEADRAPHAAHSDRVLAELRAMTPEQSRRTFIDAGIFDESGNLTEPYRG